MVQNLVSFIQFVFSLVLFVFNHLFCIHRRHRPEMFVENLEKVVLKIFSKFTGEHSCRSVISIKLLCNKISRTPFPRTALDGCFCIHLLILFVFRPCLYRIALRSVTNCISDRVFVHTWNEYLSTYFLSDSSWDATLF